MNRSKNCLLRPAYSLAFAIVYMTIILLVASTAMDNVREKLAYYKDMQGPAQARLYAESALELARSALLDGGLGFEESAGCTPDTDEEIDTDQLRCGNYTIYSLARQLGGSGDYYIPIPGTGSAAPIGTCSLRDASSFADPGHACNWNRMRFGESVVIPLLVNNPDGSAQNPVDLGFQNLHLTFRTPCKPEEGQAPPLECDDTDRYVLAEGNRSVEQDNSLVLWQVYGKLTGGTEVNVLVDDQPDRFGARDAQFNTEITESMLNEGTGFTSTAGGTGAFDVIADFLANPDLEFAFLQMNVVYPLVQDQEEGPIPYLEWQFSSNTAFPDTKATLLGDGYYETVSGIFSYPIQLQVPVTGEGTTIYSVSN